MTAFVALVMTATACPCPFVALAMTATACPCQAGGLLTNTNQNVAFLRNPARDGVIAIDGVYSNPAGVAFLPNGLHISIAHLAKQPVGFPDPYHQ